MLTYGECKYVGIFFRERVTCETCYIFHNMFFICPVSPSQIIFRLLESRLASPWFNTKAY